MVATPPEWRSLPACINAARGVPARWLLIAVGLALAACGENSFPGPSVVRLIDLAASVEIETSSAKPLGDEVEPLLREGFDAISLGDLNLIDAPSLRAAGLKFSSPPSDADDRLVGEGPDRHLVAAPGSLLVLIADVESAAAAEVSMRLWGDAPGASRVSAIMLPELPSRSQLDRPRDVVDYAVGRALHHLSPIGVIPDGEGQLYRCVIDPLLDTKALMLLVWNVGGELHIDDVEVKAVQWSAESASDAAGSTNTAIRSVTVGMDRRLAYVLSSGSTLRCPVQLPPPDPIFRCSVAASKTDRDPDLDVRISVRVEGEQAKAWTTTLSEGSSRLSGAWRDVEIDLSGLDQREALIELKVSSPGRGAVAFGEPVILARPPSETLPPDIVLISLDTVRADRLSLYGFERETSPNLSRLAAESSVFDNCITPAPWTLPSHVTLLTGQLPPRHGVREPQHRIDPGRSSLLPAELRLVGYQTLGFTGGGFVDPRFGFSNGFDSYGTRDVGLPDDQFVKDLVGVPTAERRRLLGDAPLEKVLAILGEEARYRPRFVFLHTYVAHSYLALRDDLLAVGAREDELDDLTGPRIVATLRGENAAAARRLERSDEDIRQMRLLYDATLRRADRVVGEVVAALEAGGRLDQTYLIVTSDHGEALLEHGLSGHRGHLGEPVIRVPLLVRGPGVRAGRVSNVVSTADIAPTLREAIGLPAPAVPTDGRSLMQLLTGGREPPEPALAFAGPKYALRGERWKLQARTKGGTLQDTVLFDLLRDPTEDVDRSGQEPELTERLLAALRRRVQALEASAASLENQELDSDLAEELRAIGYLIDG